MKNRMIGWCAAARVWFSPILATAQDDKEPYDARLEGYTNNVTLDGGSTGLTWILLLVMGAICLGVLFKSSGRTHLD
jgi:hypothetical protein